jgi:antitoxin MazE
MRAVVEKWGNSASVRIPVAVLQAAHLDLDEPVDVREESGRIVIESVRRKEYDLAGLVKGSRAKIFMPRSLLAVLSAKRHGKWRGPMCQTPVTWAITGWADQEPA